MSNHATRASVKKALNILRVGNEEGVPEEEK